MPRLFRLIKNVLAPGSDRDIYLSASDSIGNFEQKYCLKMILNQKQYKGDLKVGDYVYLDITEKHFDKSFDISVLAVPAVLSMQGHKSSESIFSLFIP